MTSSFFLYFAGAWGVLLVGTYLVALFKGARKLDEQRKDEIADRDAQIIALRAELVELERGPHASG